MIEIEKVHKAWLSQGGVEIPAFASRRAKVDWQKGILSLSFRSGVGELDAIALDQQFKIATDTERVTTIELKPVNTITTIDTGGGIVSAQNPATTKAIAYRLSDDRKEAKNIAIVSADQVSSGSDRLAILDKGKVAVSSNLLHRIVKIRLPILFPRQISVLQEELRPLDAHLVYTGIGGIYYWQAKCKNQKQVDASLESDYRNIKLKFSPNEVLIEKVIPL